MSNYRTLVLAAAVAAMPFYVTAQTQKNDAAKPDAANEQKMKDECEARKNEGQQTAETDRMKVTSNTTKNQDSADTSATGTSEKTTGMTGNSAEEKNKEIVQNTETAPDGSKVAEGGPAKPVENWFGCPPEKTDDAKPKQ